MSSYLGFQPTTSSPYYFVSYSTEDAPKVGPVAQILSQKLPLWYDYGLTYGEGWGKEIADHIENSEAVLLFLSKQIFAKGLNSYVYTEYQMAKDFFQKPIIIIQIESITKSDIPNELLGWWIELNRYQNIIRQPYMTDDSLANLIFAAVKKDEKIKPNTQNTVPVQENPPKIQTVDTPVSVASLLKRAFMFIDEGNWDQADKYLERVLDQAPENAQAYLGKLLKQYNVKNVQALKDIDAFTPDNLFYQRILHFGDKDLCVQVTDSLNSGYEQNMKKGDSYLSNTQFGPAERCYNIASKKKPNDYQAQWGLLRVKTQNFTRVFSHQSTIAAIKQDLDQCTSHIPREQQIQYNDQFILPYYNNLLQSNQMSRKTIGNALKEKETSQAEIEREYSKALEESKQKIKRLESDVSAKETMCKQLRDSRKEEIPGNRVFIFPTIAAIILFIYGQVSSPGEIGTRLIACVILWIVLLVISGLFRNGREDIREKKNKPINEKLGEMEAQLDLVKKNLSIATETEASRAKDHRDAQIHSLNAQYKVIDDIQQFYNK